MESNNNFIHDLVEEHIAEGGKYYGCCMCTIVGSTVNSLGNYIYTYRKLTNATDMDYVLNNISFSTFSVASPVNIKVLL